MRYGTLKLLFGATNLYFLTTKSKRNCRGSVLAEMPATMYLIFIGLLIPMIGLVTFGYRAALINFSVKDACYKASKSSTFTNAKANMNAAWTADSKLWSGVSGTPTLMSVKHPLNGGPETTSVSPLAKGTVDKTNNIYFYRLNATCVIQPIFGGSWLGMKVVGLNVPYTCNMTYQNYCESPDGLTE